MRSTERKPLLIAIALAMIVLIGAGWWISARAPEHGHVALPSAGPRAGALPLSFPTPAFAFPDQDDAEVSTRSLRGKVWVVDFIFTNCANTCPKMTAKRAELFKQIDDPRVMFLSISVDPERDNRATRKGYAGANQMDEARWKFVSPASKQEALRIAQGMKVASTGPHNQQVHGHDDSPILHSDRFVLIDADNRIRGVYPMPDARAMERLVSDALTLAKHGSTSR